MGGEGDDRGWDGWMESPTQWTWVWVNCESWWWTGRPGVLQSMGSQGVGHYWDWTELMMPQCDLEAKWSQQQAFSVLWVILIISHGRYWIDRYQEYIYIFSYWFLLVLMFLPLNRAQQNKKGLIYTIWVEEYISSFNFFQFKMKKITGSPQIMLNSFHSKTFMNC